MDSFREVDKILVCGKDLRNNLIREFAVEVIDSHESSELFVIDHRN